MNKVDEMLKKQERKELVLQGVLGLIFMNLLIWSGAYAVHITENVWFGWPLIITMVTFNIPIAIFVIRSFLMAMDW